MKKVTALTLSFGLLFMVPIALAAPSGSSGSSSGGGSGTMTSPTQLVCKTGEVIKTIRKKNKKTKKVCVKATAGIIPDFEMYDQGRLLAKQGEYEWALTVLAAVQDKSDPDVLNMMGYSNRKAGRLDVAITYYQKALSLKPDFTLAREYLGEGFVAAGRLDLARVQLNEIKKISGTTSEEYIDLAAAIDGANI